MVKTIANPVRDRIMKDAGCPVEAIGGYQPSDVPTHYVPLVYQLAVLAPADMAAVCGETEAQKATLAIIADYVRALPDDQRAKAFRFDYAPTDMMRYGSKDAQGNQIDPGFTRPLLLVHGDVIGGVLAANRLQRGSLDMGSCQVDFEKMQSRKERLYTLSEAQRAVAIAEEDAAKQSNCYAIKGYATKIDEGRKAHVEWVQGR